jgi:hypothetical protein
LEWEQWKYLNKNVMTNEQQIEEILTEASAFGLRWEVQSTAEQIMDENPNLDKVEAYQQAFSEWVK